MREVNTGGVLLPESRCPVASPSCSEPITILGPGNMIPPQTEKQPTNNLRPLSERLESSRKKHKGAVPTADSLRQLLVQSIGSGDGKLLEEVLRISKERLILSTVKNLPLHIVLPFLKKVSG